MGLVSWKTSKLVCLFSRSKAQLENARREAENDPSAATKPTHTSGCAAPRIVRGTFLCFIMSNRRHCIIANNTGKGRNLLRHTLRLFSVVVFHQSRAGTVCWELGQQRAPKPERKIKPQQCRKQARNWHPDPQNTCYSLKDIYVTTF